MKHKGALLFCLAALAAVAVYWWRCQFGVDLTDEAFYLAPAWKLFGLGDQPFRDEIFNGVRHSDLLNFLFVRPWFSFSVLTLRRAAVITYAVILLGYTLLCFRRQLGLPSALAFVLCLTFDYFLMPTWSYNWWARNFLLLHHSCLILSSLTTKARLRALYLALSGLSFGIVIVAYNSLALAWLGTLSVLVFALWQFRVSLKESKALLLPYGAGALLPLAIDGIYCLLPQVRQSWLLSVKAMASMAEYSNHGSKVISLLGYVLLQKDLWFLLALSFLGLHLFWKILPEGVAFVPKLWRRIVAGIALAYVAYRFQESRDVMGVLGGLVSLGFVGALMLGLSAVAHENVFLVGIVAASLLSTFGIALSSTNGALALYWGLPGLVIPFVALATPSLRTSGAWCFVAFLGVLVFGTFTYQRTHNYYEVPPGNCDTRLTLPPLAGLKTSARRAFLVTEIERLMKDKTFALVFAEVPGPFFFSKVRPSADTIMVEPLAAADVHRRSLHHFSEENRFPEIILKSKVRPWYWGVEHPFRHKLLAYPAGDPYVRFANCVKDKTLVDYEEFVAYSVDRSKLANCVEASTRELEIAAQ
jgi:hypothetical protein